MERIDKNNQIVSKEIFALITRENWSIQLLMELAPNAYWQTKYTGQKKTGLTAEETA